MILVASVLLALIADLVSTRVLMRLARKTRTDLDDEVIKATHIPLIVSVVLGGASLAFRSFEPPDTAVYIVDGILVTLAVLLWARSFMQIGRVVLAHLSARIDDYRWVQPRTIPLFEMTLKGLVAAGAVYGVLLAFEVDVTAWLASAGIFGIAVGFAAKDTLANLFSGIFIIADSPYKLGDFIILSSGERGRVTDIGIRSTRLLTRDDVEITVPNAAIGSAKIVNESGGPYVKERVRIAIGVAYGTDIDRLREILLEEAEKSVNLTDDPGPKVRFISFGDSALEFQLRGWVDEPVLRGRAIDELNTAIYKRLTVEGIEIP
ncbi:MAG: mechanosensitive ion channel family protein, partial [Deltaproteobacteria bacterium]|nr:mechanosensitive ion channel family protein [Deltaproteobacteria bacterium]